MLACSIGKPLIVELLLRNPDINKASKDINGNNCMYYATMQGHLSVVKKLKDFMVPYAANNKGMTCLHVAVKRGHMDIVNFFLSKTLHPD